MEGERGRGESPGAGARAFTFEVEAGGYVALMGPSRSGKSTLLGLLGGLDTVQDGTIQVGDVGITALEGDALAAYRRTTVGFVFQHLGLLDSLTAVENVELACTLAGEAPSSRRARAGELLQNPSPGATHGLGNGVRNCVHQ